MSLEVLLEKTLTFSNSFAPIVNLTTNFLELRPDISNNIGTDSPSIQSFQAMRQVQESGLVKMASNFAKAITTYIRTIDKVIDPEPGFGVVPVAGIGPANGTAYALQVYIHVRWPWISFTAAILLFTIVFLALIMAQSARHDIGIWKSSPLALIFHGLEVEDVQYTHQDNVANMQSRSKNMRVRLGNTASGVKFKKEQKLNERNA
jgi:hypothetical protein